FVYFCHHCRKHRKQPTRTALSRICKMTFSEFQKLVSKIEKIELPGEDSHFQMAPLSRRKSFDKAFLKPKNPKFAGVLVLFYPNENGEAMLVLVLRKTYAGVHSGQISLPGGRKETFDKSILE